MLIARELVSILSAEGYYQADMVFLKRLDATALTLESPRDWLRQDESLKLFVADL
jgi:hypothetical protein